MKPTTMFSIITPLFDREETIQSTIESVIQQTFTDWQMVIIDDGSTDKSLEIATSYANNDPRIVCVKGVENKGAAKRRNEGASLATGQYLIFLDSDDLLTSHALEQRLDVIQQDPGKDFYAFPMGIFYDQIGDSPLRHNMDSPEAHLYRFLRGENVWSMTGPVWHKDYFLRIGGFNDSLHSYQDWELSVRSILDDAQYSMHFDLAPTSFYRQSQASISSSRFGLDMVTGNFEMIMDVWQKLRSSDHLDDKARRCLVQFAVRTVNRCQLSPEGSGVGIQLIDRMHKAELINSRERRRIRLFYTLRSSKLSYRSKKWRSMIARLESKMFLRSIYSFPEPRSMSLPE